MKKPDWKVERDYDYTKKFQRTEWAWEFLRRNPKYRNDFADFKAGKFTKTKYSPPRKDGETEGQWAQRCIHKLDCKPIILAPETQLLRKWSLKFALPNPEFTAPELARMGATVEFDVEVTAKFYEFWEDLDEIPVTIDGSSGYAVVRSDQLVVALDAAGPIGPQIKQIRARFRKAKGKKNGDAPKEPFKPDIRALDALDDLELGIVTKHQIGEVLYQGPETNVDQAAADIIDTATNNRDRGFRAIARRSTKIKN